MLKRTFTVAALALQVAAISTLGYADTPKTTKTDLNGVKVAEPGKGGKSTEPGKTGRAPEGGKGGKSTESGIKGGS
jgi:hypothetical protein